MIILFNRSYIYNIWSIDRLNHIYAGANLIRSVVMAEKFLEGARKRKAIAEARTQQLSTKSSIDSQPTLEYPGQMEDEETIRCGVRILKHVLLLPFMINWPEVFFSAVEIPTSLPISIFQWEIEMAGIYDNSKKKIYIYIKPTGGKRHWCWERLNSRQMKSQKKRQAQNLWVWWEVCFLFLNSWTTIVFEKPWANWVLIYMIIFLNYIINIAGIPGGRKSKSTKQDRELTVHEPTITPRRKLFSPNSCSGEKPVAPARTALKI